MSESPTVADADFSEHAYAQLLLGFKAADYRFESFDDLAVPERCVVILRHDVDVDLDSALVIAKLERSLGVESTFFFLMTSDLYNVQGAHGRRTVRQISELGHSIGLHFDPTIYGNSNDGELAEQLEVEREALARLCGSSVDVFSLHKPGPSVEALRGSLPGMTNAYDPRFFEDIGYVSDSMGWWRYGHPFSQAFFKQGTMGQVVTHPVWWTSRRFEHPANRLERLLEFRAVQGRAWLAETVGPYEAWLRDDACYQWSWPDGLRCNDEDSAGS